MYSGNEYFSPCKIHKSLIKNTREGIYIFKSPLKLILAKMSHHAVLHMGALGTLSLLASGVPGDTETEAVPSGQAGARPVFLTLPGHRRSSATADLSILWPLCV